MSDTAALLKQGVRLGPKIAGVPHIRVNVKQFFGGLVSFEVLAEAMLLTPRTVYQSICAPKTDKLASLNERAVVAVGSMELGVDGPTTQAAIRAELVGMSQTTAPTLRHGITVDEDRAAYFGWKIPDEAVNGADIVVALPLARNLRKTLRTKRETQAKVRRVLIARPKIDALPLLVSDMHLLAIDLWFAQRLIRNAAGQNAGARALMLGASGLVHVMLDETQATTDPFQQTANRRMRIFEADLEAFRARSELALAQTPVAFVDAARVEERDRLPGEIMAKLDDPALRSGLEALTANPELADARLIDELTRAFIMVAKVLSNSSAAGAFADHHAIPMLRAYIAEDIEGLEDALASGKDPELVAQIRGGWEQAFGPSAADSRSVFAIMVRAAGVVNAAGANVEGPHSLGVAVMNLAGPGLLERSIARFHSGKPFSGALYRFVVRAAGLRRLEDRVDLIEIIDTRKFTAEARLKFAKRMFRGKAARGIVAIVCMVVLAGAIGRDAELSTRRVVDIAIGLGVGGLGISGLKRFQTVVERRGVTMTLRAVAGLVILLSIYSAGEGAAEAELAGDKFGFYENQVLIGSGVATLIGWLLTVGAGTSWAGVGEVLLAGAAIVSIGSLAVSIVNAFLMEGTEEFMKGAMHHLARGLPGEANIVHGEIATAATHDASLGVELAALVSTAEGLVYWELPKSRTNDLRDRGFKDDVIARILDVDLDELPGAP